jgi:hypothetical protein
MGTFRKLAVHRPWEDWLLLALGLLICFSPSLAESGYSGAPAASALTKKNTTDKPARAQSRRCHCRLPGLAHCVLHFSCHRFLSMASARIIRYGKLRERVCIEEEIVCYNFLTP